MAMDFFEQQQRARRRTGFLLFWFLLAVVLTVLALNAAAWLFTGGTNMPLSRWLAEPWWPWITAGTLIVIGTGSLTTYISLRGGGAALAKSVGARRVLPSTNETQERVLLNVVEEMAIASGTPVPSVWIMDDEPAINAFVAGFTPTQAVLVMTRGALENFDRDQLQGVVGHEFSHILNGDMRLNVQLYAILSGILLIGKLGAFLLRNLGNLNRRNDRDSAKAIPVVALTGLVLYVVGYAGLFCGRVIKAAISRQREFLADASSVQFTRNPRGIGEALLTIRDGGRGSLLRNSHAEDLSHMCMALSVKPAFSGLLATHPPLEERIKAIDPSLLVRSRVRQRRAAQAAAGNAHPAASSFAGGGATAAVAAAGSLTPAALVGSVGRPTPQHYERAQRLHEQLPPQLFVLLHDGEGARAVIYGLLISGQHVPPETGLQQVTEVEHDGITSSVQRALPLLRDLPAHLVLPCIDLAMPVLRELSNETRARFLATLAQLARLDGRVSLREYLLLAVLRRQLDRNAAQRRPVRHRSYGSVAGSLNQLLSLLCHTGGSSAASRQELHARLLAGFGIGEQPLLPPSALGADALHAALTELADLSPLLKRPLLESCVDAVRHDGRILTIELELVRAIAEALDCPVPPLVG